MNRYKEKYVVHLLHVQLMERYHGSGASFPLKYVINCLWFLTKKSTGCLQRSILGSIFPSFAKFRSE